jgi:hypothetical protein
MSPHGPVRASGMRCGDMGRRFATSVVGELHTLFPPLEEPALTRRAKTLQTQRSFGTFQASSNTSGIRTVENEAESRCLRYDEPHQSHKDSMDLVAKSRTSVKTTICNRDAAATYSAKSRTKTESTQSAIADCTSHDPTFTISCSQNIDKMLIK